MKAVDEPEFKQIKQRLRWSTRSPYLLAVEFKRSEATIQRIRGSKNFTEFQALSKAEHPPERPTTAGKKINRLLSVLRSKENLTDDEVRFVKTGKRGI